MKLASKRTVHAAMALVVLAGASSSALAQPIRVVFSNIVGEPTNAPPGLPGLSFRNGTIPQTFSGPFQKPSLSPDGQRFSLNGFLFNDGTIVTNANDAIIVSGTLAGASSLIAREGSTIGDPTTTTGDIHGVFDPQTAVRNNGDVGYVNLGNFLPGNVRDRVAIVQSPTSFSIVAREGVATGLGFNWGSNMGGFNFTSTGFAVRSQTTGAGGKDALVANGAILAQNTSGAGAVPTSQIVAPTTRAWSTFAFDKFRTDSTGTKWIGWGVVASSPGNGTMLAVNNDIKAQFGAPLPGSSFTSNVSTIDGVDMSVNGDWSARGTSSAFGEDWVLVNNVLVARTGQVVEGGPWQWEDLNLTQTFTGAAVNCRGDFAIAGSQVNISTFDIRRALVVNNGRVVIQSGDPVDLNNNGLPDDLWYIADFQNDSIAISADGWVYAIALLRADPAIGAATNAALIRVRAFCPGDYSKDGVKSIDDIFIYLNAWFAGARNTDTDCSGTNSIDDIFIFLNEWFSNNCPN